MQPLPFFSSSPSRIAYAAFAGLVITIISQGAIQLRTQPSTLLTQPMANPSEDDRGSGRLSNQPKSLDLVSFRGSGRVNPNPTKPSGTLHLSPAPQYRGSGRLG